MSPSGLKRPIKDMAKRELFGVFTVTKSTDKSTSTRGGGHQQMGKRKSSSEIVIDGIVHGNATQLHEGLLY